MSSLPEPQLLKHTLRVQLPAFVATRTVLNTMVRMVYPFLPIFGRNLGVDLWLLSLALTIRSSSGVFGPFLASIADSRGRKAGMLFGLLLFTAGVGLMSVFPSYPAFVAALVLTIVGNFVFIPSMQAFLGDRVAYQRRGAALAITEFGWSLSFILGVPLAGLLMERVGWLAPFPALTALGLLAILFLTWLLPGDKPHATAGLPNFWQNLRKVLTYGPALAGIALGFAMSGGNEIVNVVFGVWMEDRFGLQIAALGAASAVIGISELGGESLVSLLVDRIGKTRALAVGLLLNAVAAIGLPMLGQSVTGALVGLFFFYLTFEFTIVSSLPLLTEVMPSARATLMAIFIAGMSLGRALGALLASRLYLAGFWANGAAAAIFNLLALLMLLVLVKSSHKLQNEELIEQA